MCILWLFGNLLMAFTVLLCRLVVLFFLVLLLITTSPVTTLIFIANVLNGEMAFEWSHYRQRTKQDEQKNGCCEACRRLLAYLRFLRLPQLLCLASPLVMLWASTIYAALTHIEAGAFTDGLLKSHEWLDDTIIHSISGKRVEEKPLWIQVLLHTHWSIFALSAAWTIKNFMAPITVRLLLGCDSDDSNDVLSPMQAGWKSLRRQAEAMYQGQGGQERPSGSVATRGSYSALTPTDNRSREARIQEAEKPNTQELPNIEPEPCTLDTADGARRSASNAFDTERLDKDGCLILNVSSMLEALLKPDATRQLVLQAIVLIYKEEHVKLYPLHFFAMYIDLDDWYWIACSIVWTRKRNRSELELIPESRRRYISRHQRQLFTNHPVFGNYCFEPEGINVPEHGVFIEDWAYAVYDETMHNRHIRTIELLSHLNNYAGKLIGEMQEQEESELRKRHLDDDM